MDTFIDATVLKAMGFSYRYQGKPQRRYHEMLQEVGDDGDVMKLSVY